MPQGNGTGPVGAGPMTGRGAGYCAGNNAPGWKIPGGGRMLRGFRRHGTARGFFRNHAQHAVTVAEPMVLEKKIDALQVQLASLEQQLAEMDGKKET